VLCKGEDLPALTNLSLYCDGETFTAVATNRYVIVFHETKVSDDGLFVKSVDSFSESVLIPFDLLAQFVKAASANKNDKIPVQIRVDDDYVEIQMYEIMVRGAKNRGQYPKVADLVRCKEPAVDGVLSFGLPLHQLVLVQKLIAPAANVRPNKYVWRATFSTASTVDKAGPMVLTTDVDKDLVLLVQPHYAEGMEWKGYNNG
jgi:hypothetical protein